VRRVRPHHALAAGSLTLLALAGCGAERHASDTIRVEARAHRYVMPARIDGGIVSLEFVNGSRVLHEFALARLIPRTTTVAAFRRELTDDDGEPPSALDVGGIPVLGPGKHLTVTRRLAPGTYALVCYLHGRPMVGSFTVTGASASATPRPDATIVARQHRFDVPVLHPGRQTIELRNEAAGEREFQLTGLKPGNTPKEAEAWFAAGAKGPAPVVFPGGLQSIPPGASVIENLELERGVTYLLEDEHGLRARFTPR
jgi:hypothetical protein